MKSVLLCLEGPLQAWSSQGKLGIRDTEREPTKSGVLGLVGAALGMARDDDEQLAKLVTLGMAVRVDSEGSLLRDYHTAGGGRFRGNGYTVHGASDCIPSHRYYLQDARFFVALGGDEALVERIADGLRNPVWPLFLGRRSCVPSQPVFDGVVDSSPEVAVRQRAVEPAHPRPTRLRLILESSAEQGEPRHDVPVSFREGARRYTHRYVRTQWHHVDPNPGETGDA